MVLFNHARFVNKYVFYFLLMIIVEKYGYTSEKKSIMYLIVNKFKVLVEK
jgi:hypothetical protein